MKDIVGTIGKYIRDFSKEDQSTVYTPMNIAEDMVNLLPEDIFKPDKRFIDIACKSGRFLLAIYNRLMSSPYMGNMEPEQRSKWILDNQLYAIALTEISSVLIRKSLYDDYTVKGNVIVIDNYIQRVKKNSFGQNANGSVKTFRELLSEEFNQVNFDVVIGNPPYNNDIYLDFVTQGHNLAKQYDVWITPAKWQAKGGKKNEDFRKNIVPHMSKIVFYPDAREIFDIAEIDGISYYIDDKHEYSKKRIDNKCNKNKNLCDTEYRDINGSLNNSVYRIVKKLGSGKLNISHKNNVYDVSFRRGGEYKLLSNGKIEEGYNLKDIFGDLSGIENYKVVSNEMLGYAFFFDNEGKLIGSPEYKILEPKVICSSHYCVYKTFETINEAESMISYLNTKLIRFITALCLTGTTTSKPEFWRFVPDPGPFDHIFTDAELYKKYNLTPEEINIIESVIKERK